MVTMFVKARTYTLRLCVLIENLCSYVPALSGQHAKQLTSHATASALMSLEATRTLVRGRQPRSGLMCFLCKPMFLCSRGKRLTQTIHLLFFCSSVLMLPALAAVQAMLANAQMCKQTDAVALLLATLRRQPVNISALITNPTSWQ